MLDKDIYKLLTLVTIFGTSNAQKAFLSPETMDIFSSTNILVLLLWTLKLNTTSMMTIGIGNLIQLLVTQITHHLMRLLSYREDEQNNDDECDEDDEDKVGEEHNKETMVFQDNENV
jgi:hypothetical protein